MAFPRGGVGDPYITEGLDGGFVAGWRHLCEMHDALRPLLLPSAEEDDLPPLDPAVTPETAIEVVRETAAAIEEIEGRVDGSVRAAFDAMREYFEAARADEVRRAGLLRRGIVSHGGFVAKIILRGATVGGGYAGAATWAATPQGQATISALQPILERILRMVGG